MRCNRRDFLKTITLGAGASLVPPALQSADAASAPPLRTNPPNILFFFPDQHRFDWIGWNPDLPVRTPHLDALVRRGVRFTNALCPSPLCAPSRSILASGKDYDRCGVPSNGHNYPIDCVTFYTLLKNAGYNVLGCGKFDLSKPDKNWRGEDKKLHKSGKPYMDLWGFTDGIDNSGKHDAIQAYRKEKLCPYMTFLKKKGQVETHVKDFTTRHQYKDTYPTKLTDEEYCDNWIAQSGLDLVRKVPKGKPWFLQVNFNGPHEPMDVTERMQIPWKGVQFPQPNRCEEFTEEKHVEIRQNYAAMIENIDRWLGLYVEELKKRGELENTLIVYSSDHGEMLGDHGRWAKSVPYQPSVGVPLLIGGPGVKAARKIDVPTTTLDLPATFLDYARLPVPKEMDSRSLRPLIEAKTDRGRPFVRSGLGKWRLVFDGRYKLIRGFNPQRKKNTKTAEEKKAQKEELLLFDLRKDPLENHDIAGKAPEIVERLRKHFISA